jgi:hypothetical protein
VSHDVRVGVRDEGIGIAPDMRHTIFEPFVQQPQTLERSHGGLGLGLAIVRSLVEKHGGTVHVESDGLNRGSEFIIHLPAIDSPAADEHVDSPPALEPTLGGLPGARVLVVDDNADAAEMLRHALEALGCGVEVTHDGPSALERCDTFEPDIAVLDIGLPMMDG